MTHFNPFDAPQPTPLGYVIVHRKLFACCRLDVPTNRVVPCPPRFVGFAKPVQIAYSIEAVKR